MIWYIRTATSTAMLDTRNDLDKDHKMPYGLIVTNYKTALLTLTISVHVFPKQARNPF